MTKSNETLINTVWEHKDAPMSDDAKAGVYDTIEALDNGELAVAVRDDLGEWHVKAWVKKAILLYFKRQKMELMHPYAYDKIPLKYEGWTQEDFQAAECRVVPGAIVRKGAYIGKDAVIMPSFVNIAANVGAGTLIDSWATVGCSAIIGKHCHVSMQAGIGGVLEPLQANPVIIEDHCFIGAHAAVAEGVIVREGAVLGMGVKIGASTKIVNRETGEVTFGEVPAYSVVVPGSVATKDSHIRTDAAIIIKTVDASTREKTSINALLRSYEDA